MEIFHSSEVIDNLCSYKREPSDLVPYCLQYSYQSTQADGRADNICHGGKRVKREFYFQAKSVSPDLISKMFGNRVACSPIVTIEPRRRKFHKYVTLTIPAPKSAKKGMKNHYPNENSSLRLLWSITGELRSCNLILCHSEI